ncbi:hypothetical protein ACFOW4_04980 [Micromonospora sp. GCM10011542]|uniref:hypothetical protein n=1 Tax=Micromonospora sp. GCM10011542 TaxID=3317337 RepID=UPI003605C533
MTDGWPTALRTALRRGQQLVAEVPASRPGHRAWVAIHPVRTASAEQAFNLFHREFDTDHIERGRCIGPDDGMAEVRATQATNESQLDQLLASWDITPSQLTYGHRTDYPV